MADTVFKDVESAPPIQVFLLTKLYNESTDPNKVNLGVGAYRTEEGKPWVLPVVHAAELQMASDETLNHEYLPVAGLPDFRVAATRILLGLGHKVLAESKVESFQALGGTGALRLGAAFLKNVMKFNTVYISDPTWENHKGVFQAAGFTDLRQYRYWDNETRGLNFAGMCEDLNNAPAQAVILLHGVAHNPTGIDPTKEQWKEIARICKEKNLFVFVDCAYQGFASGNLDEDAWASRYLADQDIDMFVAQSFSKNFGLYNERVGNLVVITKDPRKLTEIRSQMEIQIRVMWSNPPNHGARIVTTVLNNTAFFDEWKGQISTMANRIKKMRQELLDNLKKLGTPGNWEHIIKQIGMFSYTGLTEKQVEYLKGKSIYLLSSGRISMCGLTSKNVAYVAKTMDESIRAHPKLNLSTFAGEPGPGDESFSFVEFARSKLNPPEEIHNVFKTSVIIDGELERELEDDEYLPKENESTQSFIKMKILKVLKSTSSTAEPIPNVSPSKDIEKDNLGDIGEVFISPLDNKTGLSMDAQAGTLRGSVKTFKTRSIQTIASDKLETDQYKSKAIPARFEGTMMTPVYFDGLMITPERLDIMLMETSKKGNVFSLPIKLQGGMLTTASKVLSQTNIVDEPVPVRFHGKLQGLMDSHKEGSALPVTFDGNMMKLKPSVIN